MKKGLFLLFLGLSSLCNAQVYTVSGIVRDSIFGERMSGVHIVLPSKQVAAETNEQGFYSVQASKDTVRLICIVEGYKDFKLDFYLSRDTVISVKLLPEYRGEYSDKLYNPAVFGLAGVPGIQSTSISGRKGRNFPTLLGESDVYKSLQFLPGVTPTAEASTFVHFRGEGNEENMLVMDGIPLYHTSHFLGLFSGIQGGWVDKVTVSRRPYSARFGGRTSALIDVNMKDGNPNEFEGQFSLSFAAISFALSTPLVKGKTTLMASYRRTYLDALLAGTLNLVGQRGTTANYYFDDLNAKISHTFSDRDRLYIGFYRVSDHFSARTESSEFQGATVVEDVFKYRNPWAGMMGFLKWDHVFNKKWSSTATGYYTSYSLALKNFQEINRTSPQSAITENYDAIYRTGIADYGLTYEVDYYADNRNHIKGGVYGILHSAQPGASHFIYQTPSFEIDTIIGSALKRLPEFGLYVEDQFKLGEQFSGQFGLRLAGMVTEGKFIPSIQPRYQIAWNAVNGLILHSSGGIFTQFIHSVMTSNEVIPVNQWFPATRNLPARHTVHASGGLKKLFYRSNIELGIEGFYKRMIGVVEYGEGKQFTPVTGDWERLLEAGTGEAYGAEVYFHKQMGRFHGWAGYMISWSNRTFSNINNGNPFPFKYDRRHSLGLLLNHQILPWLELSYGWTFGSGAPFTLPVSSYAGANPSLADPMGQFTSVNYLPEKNSIRIPPVHRLDINMSMYRYRSWGALGLRFGLYNAYSRLNPYSVYVSADATGGASVKQLSFFPILPSFGFNIVF